MSANSSPRTRPAVVPVRRVSTPREPSGSGSGAMAIGPYTIEEEIGKGSFAAVFKGKRERRSSPHPEVVAIKAVIRSKLTAKLLENLESEIEILKGISHHNIVELKDIFKTDSHIYLIMFYCSMGDLSLYIPKRASSNSDSNNPQVRRDLDMGLSDIYPNPPEGGLNEMIVRSFMAQLAEAIKFLSRRNVIHRDIKPQNLLLHPPETSSPGSPRQIPYLKVADFGFARLLPSQSLAETLCGSPLYMAPEILRYEKYDAKADLWSVGAVSFEMGVGRAPYRANNHVELLRRIEKGDGIIRWPDEREKDREERRERGLPTATVVPSDLKDLIRGLLRRNPVERMGFDEFFQRANAVGANVPGRQPVTEMAPVSPHREISTPRSSGTQGPSDRDEGERRPSPTTPIPEAPFAVPNPGRYSPGAGTRTIVGQHIRTTSQSGSSSPVNISTNPATPTVSSPLSSSPRSRDSPSSSGRQPSLHNKPSFSPSSSPLNPNALGGRQSPVSPSVLKAPAPSPRPSAPPTVEGVRVKDYATLGKVTTEAHPKASAPQSRSNLAILAPKSPFSGAQQSNPPVVASSEDSVLLGREYVLVEKQNVEINALADELANSPRVPQAVARRDSRNYGIKQLGGQSSERASNYPPPPATAGPSHEAAFAIPSGKTSSSPSSSPIAPYATSRPSSSPRDLPSSLGQALFRPGSFDSRYSSSPLSSPFALMSNPSAAINKVVTMARDGLKLFGNPSDGILLRKRGSKRGMSRAIARTGGRTTSRPSAEIDPAEEKLLKELEDLTHKAMVVSDFADTKIVSLLPRPPSANSNSPHTTSPTYFQNGNSTVARRPSSSSLDKVPLLGKPELVAAEALILYLSALAFLQKAIEKAKQFWTKRSAQGNQTVGAELNEVVQVIRARFNECYERADLAKSSTQDTMPESTVLAEKLIYDRALEISRAAAVNELRGENPLDCESAYETALWMLYAVMDKTMRGLEGSETEDIVDEEDDDETLQKFVTSIRGRLTALRKKIDAGGTRQASTTTLTSPSS